MKRIILCADDYGQSHAISQAAINLLKQERLAAVSCMVTSLHWSSQASWLLPYVNQCDLGLHFNLTEPDPANESNVVYSTLPKLMVKSHLLLLNKKNICAEFNAQLDAFEMFMGRLPDYIDGHQHIHQLPTVRQAIIEVYNKRLRQHGCYIRSIYRPHDLWSFTDIGYRKKLLLQLLGAMSLKKMLVNSQIPHNTSFSGIHAFNSRVDYGRLFDIFLTDVGDGGLIMCHPGLDDPSSTDVIRESRVNEYRFFASPEFIEILVKHRVSLARFKEVY